MQVESSWFQTSQPDVVVFAIATSGRNLARSPPAVKIQLRNGWDHFQLSCQREGGHKRAEHCGDIRDVRGVSHCEGTNKITYIMFGPKTIHLYIIYTSKYCCQSDDTEKISPLTFINSLNLRCIELRGYNEDTGLWQKSQPGHLGLVTSNLFLNWCYNISSVLTFML